MADQGGPRSSNVIGVGQTPKGQPYGTGAQQSRALAAVPISSGSKQPTPAARERVMGLQPGQIPTLTDPSVRPDESVTAGLPIGPGAGPEAIGLYPQAPPELGVLRQLYAKYGNDDVRRLIEWTESQL